MMERGMMDESLRSRVGRAKRLHRPSLGDDWARDGFASVRRGDFEAMAARATVAMRRIDAGEFYGDDQTRPAIVENAVEGSIDWEALRGLDGVKLKCGEDDDGEDVRLTVGDFLAYAEADSFGDDSPLYVFDSSFADRRWGRPLRRCYRHIFAEDLFGLVGEKTRPPYRWFLVGPKRSGTSVHVDPLGTAAWNTLWRGRKRWVLFPPETPKKVAKGTKLYAAAQDDEPVNYFVDVLPKIDAMKYEFVQYPGDTVFVPPGWWHAVINLDHTVAVTQNFVSRANFHRAWTLSRDSRPHMTRKWFRRLRRDPDYADLVEEARRLGPGVKNTKLADLLSQSFDSSTLPQTSPKKQESSSKDRKSRHHYKKKKKKYKHHRKRRGGDDDGDQQRPKKKARRRDPPAFVSSEED